MPSTPPRLRLRACAAGLCIAGAAGLVVVGQTTRWAEDTLLSTSGFVAALAPVPDDPAVGKLIGEQAQRQLFDAADLSLPFGEAQVRRMVADATPSLVDSAAFRWSWKAALRTSHAQLVDILRDDSLIGLSRDGLDITLHVAVKEAGVPGPLAALLPPDLDLSFTLIRKPALHRAAQAVEVTDALSGVLVPAAVGLGIAGLLLARRRVRALVVALAAIAFVTGAVRLVIAVAQSTGPSRPAVADAAVRGLTEPLTDGLVTVMAVSAFLCAGLAAVHVALSRRGGKTTG
ncbi:hypothetical protein [Streptomyces acidiscabies]|uniref:Integral membrane protein n=1 Tax=Streptomyces acidiscabies TaxID=42234 RepID=A0A0L0JX76_9ACTN|nr:hypothetical protein [Streptomyces acidiscabies]KND30151.1 hypothetical protein IQ63_29190 [Streptomyces acidiscabies]